MGLQGLDVPRANAFPTLSIICEWPNILPVSTDNVLRGHGDAHNRWMVPGLD
jgi:hypothetical protein